MDAEEMDACFLLSMPTKLLMMMMHEEEEKAIFTLEKRQLVEYLDREWREGAF